MAPVIASLSDQQLRQLVALLATSLASSSMAPSMDRAAGDIDTIGDELWRRTHGTANAMVAEPR